MQPYVQLAGPTPLSWVWLQVAVRLLDTECEGENAVTRKRNPYWVIGAGDTVLDRSRHTCQSGVASGTQKRVCGSAN